MRKKKRSVVLGEFLLLVILVWACVAVPTGGVGASESFPPGFCWWSNLAVLDSHNTKWVCFRFQRYSPDKPVFISDWDHIKTQSVEWDFDVFIKWRKCFLLQLRTQFWLSTKIPYIGIYTTIFHVKSEKCFIFFFKFPYRCGNPILLLLTDFKHTSLNPMVEKYIDLSPVWNLKWLLCRVVSICTAQGLYFYIY